MFLRNPRNVKRELKQKVVRRKEETRENGELIKSKHGATESRVKVMKRMHASPIYEESKKNGTR